MSPDVSARDRILSRLRKLKALAEKGTEGERDSADALLQAIAAEHGIDLDSLADDEAEVDWTLPFKDGWRLDLFTQLAALLRLDIYGTLDVAKIQVWVAKQRRRTVRAYVRCTRAQWLELDVKRSVLEADYKRHLKAFYRAFLVRNDLLMPYNPDGPEPTEEELENARLARTMSFGMERSALRKQIEYAGAQDNGEEAGHA